MKQESYFLVFIVVWIIIFFLVLLRNVMRRKNFDYSAEYDELGLQAKAKVLEIKPGKTKMLSLQKTLEVKVLVYPRHIPEFKTYMYIDSKEGIKRRLKQGDMIDVVYSVTTKNVNLLS